jgi:hypothetical protein
LARSEARPSGASWPAVSPPRPGCLQLQTGQEAKRNAFGAVTSPTRQAAARLTGFEDSNSSANVGINSKAAGHSAYLFGNNNNLVLLNIGGNGHSVPATVPDSESHASTEIADHRLAAARGDQGKVMEYLALGPGRELMYGPRFTAAALGRVPALQAAPNMRCAGVVFPQVAVERRSQLCALRRPSPELRCLSLIEAPRPSCRPPLTALCVG